MSALATIQRVINLHDISDPAKMKPVAKQRFRETSPEHDLVYRDGYLFCTDQDEDQFAVVEVVDPDPRRLMEPR